MVSVCFVDTLGLFVQVFITCKGLYKSELVIVSPKNLSGTRKVDIVYVWKQ